MLFCYQHIINYKYAQSGVYTNTITTIIIYQQI
jgi:hypothetical protein